MSIGKASEAALLSEYESAYAGVLHYDSFRWSAGSMLIAGVFLFWGVIFGTDTSEDLFFPASVVVVLVMTMWILYANHYRQLYLFKLHRISEIEAELGLEANRRFRPHQDRLPAYQPTGLPGHILDVILFVLIAVSGPFLAVFQEGLRLWQLVPIVIAICVVVVVQRFDSRVRQRVQALGDALPDGTPG